MSIFRQMMCGLGMHGPNFLAGNQSCTDSARTDGFERTCTYCGAVWHGRQVETRYLRTVGGWERVK